MKNGRAIAFAALLAVAAPSAALAKPYAIDPVAAEGQTVRFDQGLGSVQSERPGSDVWTAPTAKSFDKRLTLTVGVVNKGEAAAEIDVANVEAFTAEGVPLEVFTLVKLEKEAKTKAAWATFGVALVGAVAGAASSYNTSYGTYRSPYGVSTFSVRTYDPVAANINAANTSAAISQVSNNLSAKLADMSQNMLQRTTVDPGQSAGGFVTIAAPPKEATGVRVRVTFAGEVHEMQFALKR